MKAYPRQEVQEPDEGRRGRGADRRRPRRARRHPRRRRQRARREDPRRGVQALPPVQGSVRPRARPRRRGDPRRSERDALQRGRRGLRAAARRPHRDLRRAHRRARGRPRDQAGKPLHGRGGLRAPRRPDRLAGARRASEPAAGPEGAHPRRLRRRRHLRDPAGQAPRGDRRHHDGHRQRRLGPRPRRRHRHRLPNAGLRDGRAATTTSSSTPRAETRSRSRCGSSSQAASPSASPARRTRISPASSDDAFRCGW